MSRASGGARGASIAIDRRTLSIARRVAAFAVLAVMVTGAIAQMGGDEECRCSTKTTAVVADVPGADLPWHADESALGARPDYAH